MTRALVRRSCLFGLREEGRPVDPRAGRAEGPGRPVRGSAGADRGSGGGAPRRQGECRAQVLPRLVLVKMELTDETWHLVKNTPKVTGFLGGKGKPIADHARPRPTASCSQVQEGVERPKPSIIFEIGEQVRVCDGPFTSFNGMVEEVDEEKRPAQGRGVDLRPRDAGRARIRAGREGLRSFRPRGGSRARACGRPAMAVTAQPDRRRSGI